MEKWGLSSRRRRRLHVDRQLAVPDPAVGLYMEVFSHLTDTNREWWRIY